MHYVCPTCGTHNVQLCYPCWINPNNHDDCEPEIDWEAQPQNDGDKGWCQECGEHVLVRACEPTRQQAPARKCRHCGLTSDRGLSECDSCARRVDPDGG